MALYVTCISNEVAIGWFISGLLVAARFSGRPGQQDGLTIWFRCTTTKERFEAPEVQINLQKCAVRAPREICLCTSVINIATN
jgi:hypothetical protein